MTTSCRRDFLRQIAVAGAAVAPGWFRAHGAKPAHATADTTRARAEIDPRLFGSFLEHLGRAVYEGVYEPGSPLADSNGYRKDVLEEIRTLGVPIMRYPGGNFVSGYNWLDGVGPKDKRPRVLERAWNSTETNQFGTNEFLAWSKLAASEPLLAVNLGSGTAEMAAALAEYCLVDKGTKYSDLRRSHGVESPYEVKYWCLGNEMDGPWQIGHMTAREYGRKAADAARQMRVVDPSLKLIACGSSGPSMPTYLTWDREALEECYGEVDAISLHRYFNNTTETDGDPARYLALNLSLERQIEEVAATCDYVQGLKKSRKRLWLSFDEWNVWYRARVYDGKRAAAPHLLEEIYNLEDALLVGGLLNSLIRYAGRVRVACLAQIINVIAPLLTNRTQVLRQSIYYPYAWALKHARGRVLDLLFESETYEVPQLGAVPYVDVVAAFDPRTGQRCVLALNRDLKGERDLTVNWQDSGPSRTVTCETLTGSDLKAANSFDQPRRVAPQPLEPPAPGSKMTLKLPPRSYTVAVMAS